MTRRIKTKKPAYKPTTDTYPQCELNAYAKADVMLLCGECSEESGDLVVMEA